MSKSWLMRKGVKSVGLFSVVLSLVLFAGTSPAFASAPGDIIGTWQTSTNSLPQATYGATTVLANGYAYVIGGGASQKAVFYAHLNSDGTTGAWQTSANSLPTSVYFTASVVHNDYVYIMGGSGGVDCTDFVYYAHLNSDGSVDAWQTSTQPLPICSEGATAVVHNDYVYYIGGNSDGVPSANSVYFAHLNSDGTTGAWQTSANVLPHGVQDTTSAIYNDYVYVIGGNAFDTASSNFYISDAVYYAHLNSDGTTGAWQTSANVLPQALNNSSAVSANGYVYVLGGYSEEASMVVNSVYYAHLNSDGTTGAWQTSAQVLPQTLGYSGVVEANGYVYTFGGFNGTDVLDSVYFAALSSPVTAVPSSSITSLKPPDTGYGMISPVNPVVGVLLTTAVVFTGIGLALLYRQKRKANLTGA
jgi:N-acetylneuraminic acid mutarotase